MLSKSSTRQLLAYCTLAALALSAAPCRATLYYVDRNYSGASDSNSGRSLASPWLSIGKAAVTMVAGDTVLVRGGTYLQRRSTAANPYMLSPFNSRFGSVLATQNSGAAGRPIVFKTYGSDSVILRYDPAETGTGPLIGAYQRSYIVWDGFTIQETAANYQPDTGPVVIAGEAPNSVVGNQIKNCDIRCVVINYADNHNGIRIETVDNCLISGNKIRGIGNGGFVHNHAGIMTYAMTRTIIEHNDVNNCWAGIFIKGGPMLNDSPIIRYNLVHQCQNAILLMFCYNAKVYQNILYDGIGYDAVSNETGVEFHESCTGSDYSSCQPSVLTPCCGTAVNNDVYNNTIYNIYQGIVIPGTPNRLTRGGIDWRNNIVVSTHYPFGNARTAVGGLENLDLDFNSDYNTLFSYTALRLSPSDVTLSGWSSALGYDTHSNNRDPLFVNAGVRDFHLQAASPDRTAGLDFGDLNNNGQVTDVVPRGAYVTGLEVIGPTTAPALPVDVLGPSAVQDLRAQ